MVFCFNYNNRKKLSAIHFHTVLLSHFQHNEIKIHVLTGKLGFKYVHLSSRIVLDVLPITKLYGEIMVRKLKLFTYADIKNFSRIEYLLKESKLLL
jgi:hypothetical protein